MAYETSQDLPDEKSSAHSSTGIPSSVQGVPDNDFQVPYKQPKTSRVRGVSVIVTLAGINFLNTMGSGILIAALPRIAKDLSLADGLILWPAAVYALTAGCLLHVFGSVADIIGPKQMWITGSFLFVVFTVAVGFSKTGLQIIMFRTCLGASIAMCLPTTTSLITNTFAKGSWRTSAFAMSGMAQPLGYALGLVLGGIFTDTIGWRWSYYIMAMVNFGISLISIWSLPTVHHASNKTWVQQLQEDVDWIGVTVLSVALAVLLYVLAMLTSTYRNIYEPSNIALLTGALLLIMAFPIWMHLQVKRGKPALIPNRLWRNAAFTASCLAVFFCWASLNGIEYFTTLYFQQVQGLSALQSSIRYFAQIVIGTSTNVALVYLVPRFKVLTLAVVSACITLVSPAIMATTSMDQSYWTGPFWALLLCPINPWVLFSVCNLVISDAFPTELQSLAGSVFNAVAQFGNSVGLAMTATVAASITEHSMNPDRRVALMDGFRGAFWTIFSSTAIVLFVSSVGLRHAGIIGNADEETREEILEEESAAV